MNYKLASSLVCYSKRSDNIQQVAEKSKCEQKLIVSVTKWGTFTTLNAAEEIAVYL